MTWGAVAVAGAALVGGAIQSNKAGKAADAGVKSAKNQLAFDKEVYAQQQEQGKPILQARNTALAQLMSDLGLPAPQVETQAAQYETVTTPGTTTTIPGAGGYGQPQIITSKPTTTQNEIAPAQYFTPTTGNALTESEQYGLDESIRAAQIASGGQLGGNALRALQDRNVGYLSGIRENRLNRLQDIVFGTQTAVTNNQTQQLQSAGQIGNAYGNIGNARSTGYVNQSNALTGTLQNLNNAFQTYQGRQQQPVQQPPAYIA